jgi:C1A family cysteine protease
MSYAALALFVLALLAWWYLASERLDDDDRTVFFAISRLGDFTPKHVYRHGPIMHLGRPVDPALVLPRYFKYKESLLVPVRSQGKCASCWAFAICDMLADRVSLYTGGSRRENLSVQEFLACFLPNDFHCKRGGIPEIAYTYPMTNGLTTEAAYPYEQENNQVMAPCRPTDGPRLLDIIMTSDRHERYAARVFGRPGSNRSLCSMAFSNETNILNMKTEIFLNGPIVGTIMVYDDLYQYDAESVYTRSPGSRFRGGHAIEIYGWSDEGANTAEAGFQGAYWICRNSWGPTNPGSRAERVRACRGTRARWNACIAIPVPRVTKWRTRPTRTTSPTRSGSSFSTTWSDAGPARPSSITARCWSLSLTHVRA